MGNYDPCYDEDNITYGYLKKVLGDGIKNASRTSSINYSKNFGTTPTPPYSKGDTWNKDNNVYICINSREIGNNVVMDDWQLLYDKQTNKIISSSFQFLSSVELIKTGDGKVETFYQADYPSTNWSSLEKNSHIGDYYQDSNTSKTYIYTSEFIWKEVNVTSIIFDNITGHRNIFTSRPNEYFEGDIWKVNNLDDIDLFTNVNINDFLQARNSNSLFNENDWELITNELNIKANLYSVNGKMIAADNVFSNLQYSSYGKHNGYEVLGFDEFITLNDTSEDISLGSGLYRGYSDISIDIDLPDNFKVVSAFLSVFHTPVFWNYFEQSSQTSVDVWGASKNVKLYKMANEKNIKLLYQNSLTYRTKINSSDLVEIPNAFGVTSFSFTNSQDTTIERKDTINLKNYINSIGKTKLVLRTGDSIPVNSNIMCQNTGMARAVCNILGYIDLKGSD